MTTLIAVTAARPAPCCPSHRPYLYPHTHSNSIHNRPDAYNCKTMALRNKVMAQTDNYCRLPHAQEYHASTGVV